MVLLVRNEVVLAKTEVTYNTDPTPGATDAVAFSDVSWSHDGLRMVDRNVVQQGLDMKKRIYGGTLQTITLTCEVKGSGAAGTAPEYGPLLLACGLDETIVASTSVTYAPVSTSLDSCTIYYFEEGKRYILTGCRGTAEFNFEVGAVPTVTFTMTGHRTDPTDNAAPTPTYDSTDPIALVNIPFTVGGSTFAVNSFSMDLANEVVQPPSLAATDGYGEIAITGRDPGGSMDPESVLVATDAVVADFTAGTESAISLGSIGGTAGNIVDLDIGQAYYVDVSPGDRDGIRTNELQYKAAISAGDDEFSLVLT